MTKQYVYYFTRQDISPEQQIVQTAHAAYKLGFEYKSDNFNLVDETYDHIDPDETYFTVIGVRNVEALESVQQILHKFGYKYEVFFEPDLNNTPTSIGVYPVPEYERGPLLAFNLLKIDKLSK